MGKKLANTLLFLAVLAAAVGMTLYVARESSAFLSIISFSWQLWL